MSICIIPARGGSKRIKNKNIIDFFGEPLINVCIKNIRSMGLFDRIIVSSDDEEILDIASQSGAEIPFVRAAELSDDHSGTLSVIQNAIEVLDLALTETVSCIYPAAVLLNSTTMEAALETSMLNDDTFVIAAARLPCSIYRSFELQSERRLVPVDANFTDRRTQDLSVQYYDVGQFYVSRVSTWMNAKSINGHKNVLGHEISVFEGVDVDEYSDLELLKAIYSYKVTNKD